MKCRHCLVEFHHDFKQHHLADDGDGAFVVSTTTCPKCKRVNAKLLRGRWDKSAQHLVTVIGQQQFLYPRSVSREPASPSVPPAFSADYVEACNVLDISPKASAALSRRCLQHILRECAGVKHGDLASEIQQVLDAGKVPSHIADSLDAIRTIGNFAAHPIKSTSSGEIVEVEPGEAEWNLDTVVALFDFYFVQPAKTAERREALNKKLADANKPPLKK